MQALILAAGMGRRLGDLAKSIFKLSKLYCIIILYCFLFISIKTLL